MDQKEKLQKSRAVRENQRKKMNSPDDKKEPAIRHMVYNGKISVKKLFYLL